MKISIITAVYNGAETIVETLKSVAEQDYPNIEHIVVDGGSSDGTLACVNANRERVSTLISERDTGVYDAFNKGLHLASGDAIAFLNCGDRYSSSSTVSTVAAALTRDVIPAVFADVSIVDEVDTSRVVRRYSSKHFLPSRMSFGLMPAHPTLFLRRQVYEDIGGYDTGYRIAGDFEMCLRVFVCHETRYRYIPAALVIMRSGGLSNSGWRSKWQITREMQRACESNGVSTSLARLCLRFPLKALELR